MREEGGRQAALEHLLSGTLEDAELDKLLNQNLVGVEVQLIPVHADLRALLALLLHAEHDIVDLPSLGCELAAVAHGYGARHIGSIALPVAARVDEKHLWLKG